MNEGFEIRFIGEHAEFLSLRVLDQVSPHSKEYWEYILLNAEFEAQVSIFQGKVTHQYLHIDRLTRFSNELRTLYNKLTGVAILETIDGWLRIQVIVDKVGHVKITGFVKGGSYDDNTLNFALTTDQTFLVNPMQQLQLVLDQFPLPRRP